MSRASDRFKSRAPCGTAFQSAVLVKGPLKRLVYRSLFIFVNLHSLAIMSDTYTPLIYSHPISERFPGFDVYLKLEVRSLLPLHTHIWITPPPVLSTLHVLKHAINLFARRSNRLNRSNTAPKAHLRVKPLRITDHLYTLSLPRAETLLSHSHMLHIHWGSNVQSVESP